ncbi:MAG: hypothetical protein MUD10_04935 [Candidatus Pacebacteria bacterium]|jgi:hypothetical protein|nr:hypothetical protein [Candidatus Paceibacterota bacterium]
MKILNKAGYYLSRIFTVLLLALSAGVAKAEGILPNNGMPDSVAYGPVSFGPEERIATAFNYFAGLVMLLVVIGVPIIGIFWIIEKKERKRLQKYLLWIAILFVIFLLAKAVLSLWLAYNS